MGRAFRLSLVGLFASGTFLLPSVVWRAVQLGPDALHPRKLCTALASAAMMAGAVWAARGRTSGLLLVLSSASAMAGAMAFGIADWRFAPAVACGALALGCSLRPPFRADRPAALALIGVAVAIGVGCALVAGPLYAPIRAELVDSP